MEESAEVAQVAGADADAPLAREAAAEERRELVAALLAAVHDVDVLPGVPLS